MKIITRRAFLSAMYRIVSGATFFSLVPLEPSRNRSAQPLGEPPIQHLPYWLEVLSQGVSFVPEPLKSDINSWEKDKIRDRAYTALNVALKKNQSMRSGVIPATDEHMNELVNSSKYGQFLLESLPDKYEFTQEFPPLTYKSDPVRGRLFCELSRSILYHVMTTVDRPDFIEFSDFEIKLLKSAESYLREAISTFQSAVSIAPQRYKNAIMMNLASGYNNLGLTLNFLGEIGEAKEMYARALQIKPHDESIRENINNINGNASFINKK